MSSPTPMGSSIRVEFYGIPRQRAGVDRAVVELPEAAMSLGEVLAELGRRFPGLAGGCIEGRQLTAHCAANINGDRFVSDPATPLPPGCSLLILSSDAGG